MINLVNKPTKAVPLTALNPAVMKTSRGAIATRNLTQQACMTTPVSPAPQAPTPPVSAHGWQGRPRVEQKGTPLIKGQKVNLSQLAPGLDVIEIGFGWDVPIHAPIAYDLNAQGFFLGETGRVLSDDWFLFYGQPTSPDGACRLLDNTGSGAGDEQTMSIQLSKVNPQVGKIALVISIHDALVNQHHFGDVRNVYVRLVDKRTNQSLLHFPLTDDSLNVRSFTVGELYYKSGAWRFSAVGQGLDRDLEGLCQFYGVALA